MRLHSHRTRPFHLGPLALEKLARMPAASSDIAGGSDSLNDTSETVGGSGSAAIMPVDPHIASDDSISAVLPEYFNLFTQFLDGPAAPARAPVRR